ncbi:MAG: DNA repair protein RecO [Patescibacteria group bacterium]|nr:DNA repair protein RecO [Patescibacteria group bacterium]
MEYISKGLILRSYNFKERDRMYFVFSPNNGLIKAFAKSVRGDKSKLSGFLNIPNISIFQFASSSDVSKILQVKNIRSYENIFNNFDNFLIFNELAEILLFVLGENIQEENIYNLTILFLEDLDNNNLNLYKKKKIELVYFVALLNYLGFKPKNIVNLDNLLSKFVLLMFQNSYLKNRDLMIKLRLKEKDFISLRSWFRSYFENTLEKKINSFL